MRAGSRSAFTPADALLFGILALFWGNSFLFVKIAVPFVPPPWIVAIRILIGSVLLLALVVTRRQALPRAPRRIAALFAIGFVGTAFPWTAQSWAQQYIDSGLMAVLNATTPAATLLIAVVAGQERLHTRRLGGLGIAIIGTVVVIGGEVSAGGALPALLVGAGAPVGYALGTVLAREWVSGRVRPLPAATVQLGTAALAMLPLAAVSTGAPAPDGLPVQAALALLALGVLGTGVAFLLYFTLIERVGATNAAMVTYVVPLVGLAAGALILSERFGRNVLVGAVVLIAGVYLAQREPAVPATVEAPTAPSDEVPAAGGSDVEGVVAHAGQLLGELPQPTGGPDVAGQPAAAHRRRGTAQAAEPSGADEVAAADGGRSGRVHGGQGTA